MKTDVDNCNIMFLNIIHRPVSYLKLRSLLFLNTTFQRLNSVFVFRWNLLSWAIFGLTILIEDELHRLDLYLKTPATSKHQDKGADCETLRFTLI
jgi:hypothetical protein